MLLALNWLEGVGRSCQLRKNRHSGHLHALKTVWAAVKLFVSRFDALDRSTFARGWAAFEAAGSASPLELVAERVDIPTVAGTVKPTALVSSDLKCHLRASSVFPNVRPDLSKFQSFYAGPRAEYVRLTLLQLRAGCLELSTSCTGGGTVFLVKKAGERQRVVWHGSKVSAAASKPPAPQHLASPSVFGFIDLELGKRLRVTKRDCRTWFDQLVLPEDLRLFMARSRVSLAELVEAGGTHEEISEFLRGGTLKDATSFYPLSKNWPMGFSWSSAVAQGTLLAIAADAGLNEDLVWGPDAPLPRSWELGFALATDDLMIFSDTGPGSTQAATARFEKALCEHGAVKYDAKDVDDALNACCMGIDLVEGLYWMPPAARLWELIDAVCDLSVSRRCSPGATAGYLGVTQWFGLLRRLCLSVFDGIYAFCSGAQATNWEVTACPDDVLTELLVDAALSLFGVIDMSCPSCPPWSH